MTPQRRIPGTRQSSQITRRASSLHTNNEHHGSTEVLIEDTISRLGTLARGLDLLDESDARIYSRRVTQTLSRLTDAVVARILDDLGGDSGRHRTMVARIDAVHRIVTAVGYWRT